MRNFHGSAGGKQLEEVYREGGKKYIVETVMRNDRYYVN